MGVREIIYIIHISQHCHHQNDSCIKVGSNKSHFNDSLIVRDKVTNKTVSADHNFLRERTTEAESNQGPSAYQPNAFPLGQTGSQACGGLILYPSLTLKSQVRTLGSCLTEDASPKSTVCKIAYPVFTGLTVGPRSSELK